MPIPVQLLAFDTSTDRLSIAVSNGIRVWQHSGAGGAQASTTLIPATLALLEEAGMTLDTLDALVFGRGPGSFTGLRTACAVVQGLAFGARQGAGLPVLPVDTLMAVVDEARAQSASEASDTGRPLIVTALLDARMDELYVQSFIVEAQAVRPLDACVLVRPEAFMPAPGAALLAGNAFDAYGTRLPPDAPGQRRVVAWPTAAALLRLAPGLLAAGHAVDAAHALPLYVRDKVAFTTAEREAARTGAVP